MGRRAKRCQFKICRGSLRPNFQVEVLCQPHLPSRVARPDRPEKADSFGWDADGQCQHRGAPVRQQRVEESNVQSPNVSGGAQCELFPKVHDSMLNLFSDSIFWRLFYTLIATLQNETSHFCT